MARVYLTARYTAGRPVEARLAWRSPPVDAQAAGWRAVDVAEAATTSAAWGLLLDRLATEADLEVVARLPIAVRTALAPRACNGGMMAVAS